MQQYKELLQTILSEGTTKSNRTGEDTLSLFHYSYKIDIRQGFPLLTGKKINFDNIFFELLWFLSGDNKVDWLHKHGIHFWDEWIEDGNKLPEAYGKFWRSYPVHEEHDSPQEYVGHFEHLRGFDQFAIIINELKTNPNSRRLVLTNWYPPSAWTAKLPPCHLMCIFNVQYDSDGSPYLNLEMLQRSCDVPVGVPFNIASYALLLGLVSHLVQIPARYFAHTLVDAHIYKNQLDGVHKYLERDLKKLPCLMVRGFNTLEELDLIIQHGTTEDIRSCFLLPNYNPHPFIKFPIMV